MSLCGGMKDPSNRLRGLVRSVRRVILSAGLRLFPGAQDNEEGFIESERECQLVDDSAAKQRKTLVDYHGNIVKKKKGGTSSMPFLFANIMKTS